MMVYIYFASTVAILATLLYGRRYGMPASPRCAAVANEPQIQYLCAAGNAGKSTVGEKGITGRDCKLRKNNKGQYECFYDEQEKEDQRIRTDQMTYTEYTMYTLLFFICLWSTWTLYTSSNQGRFFWIAIVAAGLSTVFFLQK